MLHLFRTNGKQLDIHNVSSGVTGFDQIIRAEEVVGIVFVEGAFHFRSFAGLASREDCNREYFQWRLPDAFFTTNVYLSNYIKL